MFSLSSGGFHGGQTVLREEGQIYLGLDPCTSDVVELYIHIYLRLSSDDKAVCYLEEGCELW